MKKLSLYLLLIFAIILPKNAQALTLDKNNIVLGKGSSKTIDLYVDTNEHLKEITFSLVYTTYDVPGYFNVDSNFKDVVTGIKHKITFQEPISGKIKLGSVKINVVNDPKVTSGTINIHTAKALTTNDESISLNSQVINVAINNQATNTEETEPSKIIEKNLLDKIESNIVNIELKENIYEYQINIKKDIEELDLIPIAKKEEYKVNITTQKINELTDNQIIITVKSDNIKEEYKIKVNVIEEIEKVEIDEDEFNSTYKYKGKWTVLIILLTGVLLVGLLLNKKNR